MNSPSPILNAATWERISLPAVDRSRHLDADAAVALLESAAEEVRPVGADRELLVLHRIAAGVGVEAERLGVLADARERHDRLAGVRVDRLERRHQLVVRVGIRRPALA